MAAKDKCLILQRKTLKVRVSMSWLYWENDISPYQLKAFLSKTNYRAGSFLLLPKQFDGTQNLSGSYCLALLLLYSLAFFGIYSVGIKYE
jgi:hypothetical protein